jgi:hypothetical protein
VDCPAGEAIHSRLLDSRLLDNAEAIALYVPCQRLNEVDTSILMENELRKGSVDPYTFQRPFEQTFARL